MNRRWEIHLDAVHYAAFHRLMRDNNCDGFTAAKVANNVWWIIAYPSEDVRLIATLRFSIFEVIDKYGIDVPFTDCPGI